MQYVKLNIMERSPRIMHKQEMQILSVGKSLWK
jgi:hypothetical protein